jgi:hypothetical protein
MKTFDGPLPRQGGTFHVSLPPDFRGRRSRRDRPFQGNRALHHLAARKNSARLSTISPGVPEVNSEKSST